MTKLGIGTLLLNTKSVQKLTQSISHVDTLVLGESAFVLVIESDIEGVFALNFDDREMTFYNEEPLKQMKLMDSIAVIGNELLLDRNRNRKHQGLEQMKLSFKKSSTEEFKSHLFSNKNSSLYELHNDINLENLYKRHSVALTPTLIILSKSVKRFLCKANALLQIESQRHSILLVDQEDDSRCILSGKVEGIISIHAKNNANFMYQKGYDKRGGIFSCFVYAENHSKVAIKANGYSKLVTKDDAYIDFQSNPNLVEAIQFDNSKINYPLKHVFSG